MLAILTMVKNVETNVDSMENITTGVGQYLAAGKIAPQKVAYSQWAGAKCSEHLERKALAFFATFKQ